MSFSSKIKEELSKLNNLSNKEIVKAEFVGYLLTNHTALIGRKIRFSTESEYNINRFHKLLDNSKIKYDIEIQRNVFSITFKKEDLSIHEIQYKEKNIELQSTFIPIQKEDVLKAYVRGAYLGRRLYERSNQKVSYRNNII